MRPVYLTIAFVLAALGANAQENPLIDIDIDKTEWYESPILWVAVLVFFAVLIVATRRKRT